MLSLASRFTMRTGAYHLRPSLSNDMRRNPLRRPQACLIGASLDDLAISSIRRALKVPRVAHGYGIGFINCSPHTARLNLSELTPVRTNLAILSHIS